MTIKVVFNFLGIPFKLERDVPDGMNDLNEEQYVSIFKYMYGVIRELDLIGFFYRLPLCIAWLLSVRKYWRYKLLTGLNPFTDFERAVDHFIITRIPDTNLKCDAKRFKGISFMQFMFADTMFTQFVKSEKQEHLYAFMAALYMKDSESFNDVNIDKRVEYLRSKNIHPYIQNAVIINYMMQKKWLSMMYGKMFGNNDPDGSSSHEKQQNWVSVFDAFVGEHIADTEYYKNMECMDAFRIINNRLKNYEKHGK